MRSFIEIWTSSIALGVSSRRITRACSNLRLYRTCWLNATGLHSVFFVIVVFISPAPFLAHRSVRLYMDFRFWCSPSLARLHAGPFFHATSCLAESMMLLIRVFSLFVVFGRIKRAIRVSSTGHLVGSGRFSMRHRSCSLRFWCMFTRLCVEVWAKKCRSSSSRVKVVSRGGKMG